MTTALQPPSLDELWEASAAPTSAPARSGVASPTPPATVEQTDSPPSLDSLWQATQPGPDPETSKRIRRATVTLQTLAEHQTRLKSGDSRDIEFETRKVQDDLRGRLYNVEGGKPDEAYVAKYTTKKGLGEQLGEIFSWSGALKRSPLAGQAKEGEELVEKYNASKRLETGDGTAEDWKIIADDLEKQADAARDRTWGAAGADIASAAPAFGIDFAISGGLAAAGKGALKAGAAKIGIRATEKAAASAVRKSLEKAVGEAATIGLQTLAMPQMVFANTMREMVPRYKLQEGDDQRIQYIADPSQDKGFLEALARGLADTSIELYSERSGEMLGRIGGYIGKEAADLGAGLVGRKATKAVQLGVEKLGLAKARVVGAWMDKTGLSMGDFSAKLQKLGWNGILEEMGEEEVGKLLRSVVPGGDPYRRPTYDEIMSQLVGFGAYGGGLHGGAGAVNYALSGPNVERFQIGGLTGDKATNTARLWAREAIADDPAAAERIQVFVAQPSRLNLGNLGLGKGERWNTESRQALAETLGGVLAEMQNEKQQGPTVAAAAAEEQQAASGVASPTSPQPSGVATPSTPLTGTAAENETPDTPTVAVAPGSEPPQTPTTPPTEAPVNDAAADSARQAAPTLTKAQFAEEARQREVALSGREHQTAARVIKAIGGKAVHFFDHPDQTRNGFYDPADPGHVWVSASNSAQGVYEVLTHEWTHDVEATDAEAYQELETALKETAPEYYQKVRQSYSDVDAAISEEDLNGETVASVAQDLALGTDFWRRAQRTPGLVTKVAGAIKSVVRRITGRGLAVPAGKARLLADIAAKAVEVEAQQVKAAPVAEQAPQETPEETPDAPPDMEGERTIRASVRREPPPKKTVVGYKIFRTLKKKQNRGKIFPLFADKEKEVPIGIWLNADFGKTNMSPRPGWHLGELPIAPQIGTKREKTDDKPSFMDADHVWAEVEAAADVDWQAEANRRMRYKKNGEPILQTADIKNEIPKDGYYKYKTNAANEDPWIITGAIKVRRLLTDDEVDKILRDNGREPMPRHGGPKTLEQLGFAQTSNGVRQSVQRDNTIGIREPNTAEFKEWSKYSTVRREDGSMKPVFHGNQWDQQINVFNPDHKVKEAQSFGGAFSKVGTWFSDDPDLVQHYTYRPGGTGGSIYPVFLNIKSPKRFRTTDSIDAYGNNRGVDAFDAFLADWLKMARLLDGRVPAYEGTDAERAQRIFEADKRLGKKPQMRKSRGAVPVYTVTLDRRSIRHPADVPIEDAARIREAYRYLGYDGIILEGTRADSSLAGSEKKQRTFYITFDPNQIKSAIGNRGTFDPSSPDIRQSVVRNPVASRGLRETEKGVDSGEGITDTTVRSPSSHRAAGASKEVVRGQFGERGDLFVAQASPITPDSLLPEPRASVRRWRTWADEFQRNKKIQAVLGEAFMGQFVNNLAKLAAAYGDMSKVPPELAVKINKKGEVEVSDPNRSNSDPLFKYTFDLTTMCPQQDQFVAICNSIEQQLGTIMTPYERTLVSEIMQGTWTGAMRKSLCWYCYGQAARNAAENGVTRAAKIINELVEMKTKGLKITDDIIKDAFDGWSDTGMLMQTINKHYKEIAKRGPVDALKIRDIMFGYEVPSDDFEKTLSDAVAATIQGGFKPNMPKGYAPYWKGFIAGNAKKRIEKINAAAGQRFNSQTDFRPWHTMDVIQALAHLEFNKGMVHVYTKSPEFVRIFGRTGMKFNLSIEYAHDSNGKLMYEADGSPMWNGMNGFPRAEAMRLRKLHSRDVGTMLVATSEEALRAGLADPNIDMIIPYHAGSVPVAVDLLKFAHDFSKEQHEHVKDRTEAQDLIKGVDDIAEAKRILEDYARKRFKEDWTTAKLRNEIIEKITGITASGKPADDWYKERFPPKLAKWLDTRPLWNLPITREHHNNDLETYKQFCEDHGLEPRFARWIGTPGYMKMVRDVAREPSNQVPVSVAGVDWDAATEVVSAWEQAGGDRPFQTPDQRLLEHILRRIQQGNFPTLSNEQQKALLDADLMKKGEDASRLTKRFAERGLDPADSAVAAKAEFERKWDAKVAREKAEMDRTYTSMNPPAPPKPEKVKKSRGKKAAVQASVRRESTVTREQLLANPVTPRPAREMVSEVDREWERQGLPQSRPRDVAQAEADRKLATDYDGERKRLLDLVNEGGQFSDTDTLAAKMIITREAMAAIESGDLETLAAARAFIDAYRRSGTMQARAFAARFDPLETAVQRQGRIIVEAIVTPRQETGRALKKAQKAVADQKVKPAQSRAAAAEQATSDAREAITAAQADLDAAKAAAEAEKSLDDLLRESMQAEAAAPAPRKSTGLKKAKEAVGERKARAKQELNDAYAALEKFLKGKLFSGIDPQLVKLTGTLLTKLAKSGVLTFADATLAIAQRLPDHVGTIAPAIERGWSMLKDLGYQVDAPGSVDDVLAAEQARLAEAEKRVEVATKEVADAKAAAVTAKRTAASTEKQAGKAETKAAAESQKSKGVVDAAQKRIDAAQKRLDAAKADSAKARAAATAAKAKAKSMERRADKMKAKATQRKFDSKLTVAMAEQRLSDARLRYAAAAQELSQYRALAKLAEQRAAAATKRLKTVEAKADAEVKRLIDTLKKLGINFSKGEIDKILSDPNKTAALLREIASRKGDNWDVAYEYRINFLLSNPATQTANMLGNTTHFLWRNTAERFLEAALGTAIRTGTLGFAGKTMPGFGELIEIWSAILPVTSRACRNWMQSFSNAYTSFSREQATFERKIGHKEVLTVEEMRTAIGGTWGRFVRSPGRMLLAMDELCKTLFATAEVGAQALRIAKREGVKGDMLGLRMAELMNDYGSEAWLRAMDETHRILFQSEVGAIGKAVLNVRASTPGVRYVFPFVTVPINVFKQGLKRTPLGLMTMPVDVVKAVRSGDWSKVSADTAQQIIAWGLTLALMSMLKPPGDDDEDGTEPRITGASDKTHPMSVRAWGRWISYARVEPIGTALGTLVDIAISFRNGDIDAVKDRVFTSIVNQIENKTFLTGVSDLMRGLIYKDMGEFGKWGANFVTSWMPNFVRAGVRNASETVPERRVWGHGTDWVGMLGKRLVQGTEVGTVFYPDSVKRTIWGDPLKRTDIGGPVTDWVYRMTVPINVVKDSDVFVGDRVIAAWDRTSPTGEKPFDTALPMPTYLDASGKTQYMTPDQYNEFLRRSGSAAKKVVEQLPLNSTKPTKTDMGLLKEAIDGARDETRRGLANQWLGNGDAPDIDAVAEKVFNDMRKRTISTLMSTPSPGYGKTQLERDRAKLQWKEGFDRAKEEMSKLRK